jgi:hypothetical protein
MKVKNTGKRFCVKDKIIASLTATRTVQSGEEIQAAKHNNLILFPSKSY